MTKYEEFLLSKMCLAQETGLDIKVPLIKFKDGTKLKPHQRDSINWAINLDLFIEIIYKNETLLSNVC